MRAFCDMYDGWGAHILSAMCYDCASTAVLHSVSAIQSTYLTPPHPPPPPLHLVIRFSSNPARNHWEQKLHCTMRAHDVSLSLIRNPLHPDGLGQYSCVQLGWVLTVLDMLWPNVPWIYYSPSWYSCPIFDFCVADFEIDTLCRRTVEQVIPGTIKLTFIVYRAAGSPVPLSIELAPHFDCNGMWQSLWHTAMWSHRQMSLLQKEVQRHLQFGSRTSGVKDME